jgi:prepilin-type processing-associated H-X9-DG protein
MRTRILRIDLFRAHARRKFVRMRAGFKLIELVVVVGIVVLLLGLLLPAVQSVRASVRKLECQNKMKQIALALQTHADVRKRFPSGTNLTSTRRYLSWSVPVLPFLEQTSNFELSELGFAQGGSALNVVKHPLIQIPNNVFACPEDSRVSSSAFAKHSLSLVGLTSYLGCSGLNYSSQDGVLFAGSSIRLAEISDGLTNTLLIGERPPSPGNDFGWWYAGVGTTTTFPFSRLKTGCLDHTLGVRETSSTPYASCDVKKSYFHFPLRIANECDATHYWSLHSNGGNFAMCDGSVHFIAYSDTDILDKLATRNGHEIR